VIFGQRLLRQARAKAGEKFSSQANRSTPREREREREKRNFFGRGIVNVSSQYVGLGTLTWDTRRTLEAHHNAIANRFLSRIYAIFEVVFSSKRSSFEMVRGEEKERERERERE